MEIDPTIHAGRPDASPPRAIPGSDDAAAPVYLSDALTALQEVLTANAAALESLALLAARAPECVPLPLLRHVCARVERTRAEVIAFDRELRRTVPGLHRSIA